MYHHLGRVAKTSKFPQIPWEAACSCGTHGDFKTMDEAVNWMNAHHRKGSSLDTHELVVTKEPEAVPVKAAAAPVESKTPPVAEKPVEAAAPAVQESAPEVKPSETPDTGNAGK
jgi:hypothetical protein